MRPLGSRYRSQRLLSPPWRCCISSSRNCFLLSRSGSSGMIPRKGTADVYLSAEFYDKEATSLALLELKAKGFDPASLAVFSDQPLELADGVLDRPSRMSLAVVTSAIVFLLLIIWFVYYTQYDYPLVTGGMPLFSFWATGVIFYEITMFGAIAATFILFLLESGLLRR